MSTYRDSIPDNVYKCDNCGKFVSADEAYYCKEDPEDEFSELYVFCNERCESLLLEKAVS